MPEPATLLVFLAAALVLIAIPGPNLVYIATRSASEGRSSGLASALGVETGTLVHVGLATAGLSALLASSAVAFSAVKYLGAAYLILLGLRALRRPTTHGAGPGAPPPAVSLRRAYRQGLLVQLLNPKVAIFFLAFLPQFVDPARGTVALQILVLGAILALVGLAIDAAYAVAAASVGRRVRARGVSAGRAGDGRAGRRATGAIYLTLGVVAALTGERRAPAGP
jgi:threonine/homoserine/homoserine lactone efflux protein